MSNYLPRTVSKSELARYWGCSLKIMWSSILTPDLLHRLGADCDEVKRIYVLGPELTLKIYEHFDIVDLNESVAAQLLRRKKKKEQARKEKLAAVLR